MNSNNIPKPLRKGLLYFAKNPSFQHLIKIGQTSKIAVIDRNLSTTNVPEDFEYLAVFQCEDAIWAEKKLHTQFAKFNHVSETGRRTEFYWIGCIEEAKRYARDLKGVAEITQEETEKIEIQDDRGKPKIRNRPNSTFEMIGLEVGTEILFKNDPNFVAVVADNKNQITYSGQTKSISTLAIGLLQAQGSKATTANGFEHFYVNGTKLVDLRLDKLNVKKKNKK